MQKRSRLKLESWIFQSRNNRLLLRAFFLSDHKMMRHDFRMTCKDYCMPPTPPQSSLRPCSVTREWRCHLTDENSVCEMNTALTCSQADHSAVQWFYNTEQELCVCVTVCDCVCVINPLWAIKCLSSVVAFFNQCVFLKQPRCSESACVSVRVLV